MIYECIGLPGAGKSYISSQKCSQKQIKEISISGTKERMVLSAMFAFGHPIFFVRLLWVFVKENYKNPILLKHKLMTVILEIAAREQKATKLNSMVETGFFQMIMSLYERKINENEISFFVKWLKGRPYMIYIIDADSEIRNERMKSRGRVPRSGIISDPEKLAEWFVVLEYNFNIVKKVVKNNFNYEAIQNN